MNAFVINMLLAFAWAGLTGEFSLASLLTGLVVGFFALWLSAPLTGIERLYFVRVYRIVRLALYFLYELTMSSLRVAWDVIRPFPRNRPALVEMPLDVKSDIEILLVTNLISLTPGTLSVDVSPDRSTLLVHAMFADDHEAVVADLKSGLERLVAEVFEQ
jgi:multicomponent Na+:H+ antiporter subunit E